MDNVIDKVLAKFGLTDEDLKEFGEKAKIIKKLADSVEFSEEADGDIRITVNPRKATIFLKK